MGSVCARRLNKDDPRPLSVSGQYETQPTELGSIMGTNELDDLLREVEVPIGTQIRYLVPAILWALCGWNIVVGLPEALYWHFLDSNGMRSNFHALLLVGLLVSSFLFLDFFGMQRFVSANAGLISILPPLFFSLSAMPPANTRLACLTVSAATLGWSVVAVVGCVPEAARRQRDGWACLIALVGLLMIRWFNATVDPFLAEPVAKVTIGFFGLLYAGISAWEEHPIQRIDVSVADADKWPQCSDLRGCFAIGKWLSATAVGLMGGSALVLFQTYLSTLQAPAASALLTPSYLLALWTLAALTFGIAALVTVFAVVPWWLDTCQAALGIGALPLVACALQWTSGTTALSSGQNNVGPGDGVALHGTGSTAHAGLLALAGGFPFMLALFGKELYLQTRSKSAGRALFVAGLVWLVCFHAHIDVLSGAAATIVGMELTERPYIMALALGIAWSIGVIGAPNGAGRPSVHELWYMSQHSAPKRSDYSTSAVILFLLLYTTFLGIALPMRVVSEFVEPCATKELLIVAEYNVQQGYDLHGQSNVRCVSDALHSASVDLVGLSEVSPPQLFSGNEDISLAYATRLKMNRFEGASGAVGAIDGGILSRLPLSNVSSRRLEAHLWTRSRVTWNKLQVDFHAVHTDRLADPSHEVEYIAEQIRIHYPKGPLVLVGAFNLPRNKSVRPSDTAMKQLISGTGLKEAFGALDTNVTLPLPSTEISSGLHVDYIFYRELEIVGAMIHNAARCSNHFPLVVSFHLPGMGSTG